LPIQHASISFVDVFVGRSISVHSYLRWARGGWRSVELKDEVFLQIEASPAPMPATHHFDMPSVSVAARRRGSAQESRGNDSCFQEKLIFNLLVPYIEAWIVSTILKRMLGAMRIQTGGSF
jgi:hypothetical protein